MDESNAQFWIDKLELQPHPEGGFYKEIYRSQNKVLSRSSALERNACTSIYYLLEGGDYSGFHRIKSDELWYFHKGTPLNIHIIDEFGIYTIAELSDKGTGDLSVVVKAGNWFAAEIPSKASFTLVSCAVAPGFEFTEFEMAERKELVTIYPEHARVINKLCRV